MSIVPSFFDMTSYVILSGSMEPEIPVGSVVFVDKDIECSDIRRGDIIAFNIDESKRVTHRVTDIDEDQQLFTTKGDANETEDFSPVRYDQVIGKTVYHIPYVGYVTQWLSQTKSKAVIVSVFAGQLLIVFLLEDKKENNTGGKSNEI